MNYTSLTGRVFWNLKDEKDENFYQLQNYPLYTFQLKVFSDKIQKWWDREESLISLYLVLFLKVGHIHSLSMLYKLRECEFSSEKILRFLNIFFGIQIGSQFGLLLTGGLIILVLLDILLSD